MDRVLEFGTKIEITVGIPGGGMANLSRVLEELRERGLPENARVVATAGGMSPEDLTVTATWDEPSEEWSDKNVPRSLAS